MMEMLMAMAVVAAVFVVLNRFRTRYLMVSSGQPACGLSKRCSTCGICHEQTPAVSTNRRNSR